MFSYGYLLMAATAIVVATPIVTATPIVAATDESNTSPRSMNINSMMNKTVCAIEVHYNNNSDRIPYKIKEIKCAKKTDQWCEKNNIPSQNCCNHTETENKQEMVCAEMIDKVQVYYKSRNDTAWLDVAVGCSCVIEPSKTAAAPPRPPY